jgi:hypothetical protein
MTVSYYVEPKNKKRKTKNKKDSQYLQQQFVVDQVVYFDRQLPEHLGVWMR